MTALWILYAVTFPWLCAAVTMERLLAVRPRSFDDPGGWKLPGGEVAVLAAAFGGLCFVAVVDVAVNR